MSASEVAIHDTLLAPPAAEGRNRTAHFPQNFALSELLAPQCPHFKIVTCYRELHAVQEPSGITAMMRIRNFFPQQILCTLVATTTTSALDRLDLCKCIAPVNGQQTSIEQ